MDTDELLVDPDDPEAIAEGALLPVEGSPLRTKFLSYRACGFAVGEALKLSGASRRILVRWRKDPTFFEAESQAVQLKTGLAKEYVTREFLRNFRLLLDVDRQVITRAQEGEELTRDEVRYLERIQGLYTPDQYKAITSLLLGDDKVEQEWDFVSILKARQVPRVMGVMDGVRFIDAQGSR